jgi:RND family efflux transporter MFP subunit
VEHYLPNNFTVVTTNQKTHETSKSVQAPSDAEIATARAAYIVAQATLQESQWYYNALTGGEVPDNATGTNLNTLLQSKLDLQSAQTALDGTQLIAPFNGIVTTVGAQLGDSVGSSAIITIADTHTLYVQTYIDETDFAMFKAGNSANVVFNALPNQTFTGKVVEVDPSLVTNSGSSAVSGLVQLDPTSTELLIGMTANVNIIGGQAQNAVLVPVSALHEYAPGKYAVFVMRNGKLAVAFVDVGLQDPVNAEITSGLQPGDVISTGLVGTRTQ